MLTHSIGLIACNSMHLLPVPVVLDTNTVMALWWFEDPRLHLLQDAVFTRELRPLCRPDALDELAAVLAYRQFGIAPQRQQTLLQTYRLLCTPLTSDEPVPPLPRCRDRDDQKFLEIAAVGQSAMLITRDKALLRLNRHRLIRPLFRILTPERLCDELPLDENHSQARTTPADACVDGTQKSYSSS